MDNSTQSAIVLGATGLTGRVLLSILETKPEFQVIKAITRCPIKGLSPKIEQILIKNLDEIKSDDPRFSANMYFCCLGTTIKTAGSKEAFKKVDFEGVQRFSETASAQNGRVFVLISAAGADPNSSVFYNRIKGEAEKAVLRCQIHRTVIFRPGLLMGNRNEHRPGEAIALALVKCVSYLLPNALISRIATPVGRLAERMVQESLIPRSEIKIIEAKEI